MTVNAGNDTDVAFKNCVPISACNTEINDVFIDEANHIYIAMPIYNLIEYSDNYSGISGTLRHFKKDEVRTNKDSLRIDHSQSFKSKAALVRKTSEYNNGNNFVKNTKIVVPLKCLSSFLRSLEMSLINCKILLELNLIEHCILSRVGDFAKLKITDAKLHVPIVTLSTKDNVNLTKQLIDEFKRSAIGSNIKPFL